MTGARAGPSLQLLPLSDACFLSAYFVPSRALGPREGKLSGKETGDVQNKRQLQVAVNEAG